MKMNVILFQRNLSNFLRLNWPSLFVGCPTFVMPFSQTKVKWRRKPEALRSRKLLSIDVVSFSKGSYKYCSSTGNTISNQTIALYVVHLFARQPVKWREKGGRRCRLSHSLHQINLSFIGSTASKALEKLRKFIIFDV